MQQLTDIKDYILSKFDSFDNGFANVAKPNNSNIVHDDGMQNYVGIADNLGNYFYIRSLKEQNYSIIKRGGRAKYYERTTNCRIVIVHHDFNETDCLHIAMRSLSAKGHTLTASDTDKTRVFRNETGTDLTANIHTIISADFTVRDVVTAINCETLNCDC